ncbi:hypothetical protein [Falsiruegeria litorea]|uniref:hypothetical protein n=1 Tax=Falsiruegeria litorea TaxID=1280831 RepID=UPI001BFE221B|nr:hypothetical protein [Falsiruegeria litorea]MBT8167603.1 hypothetical protein [Falsiruegeria litorea]
MNTQLRDTTFIVCAGTSGVLNYFGLSEMAPDGDFTSLALFALTGFAVSLALILFWNHAFSIVPDLKSGARRTGAWATILTGIILIIGISTWWNIVGVAGDEIVRLSAADVLQRVEIGLAKAINDSGQYLSNRSDVAAFFSDVTALILAETNGATSGASGAGPISLTMGQVETRLDNLVQEIDGATSILDAARTKGDACLAALQSATSVANQAEIAKQVACANGVISDLGNQDVLATISRGLRTLTDGIVFPASVRTDSQHAILNSFLADTQSRADGIVAVLSNGSETIFSSVSAEMPNLLLGVLTHWKSLIPVISTALALDLLPLVLLVLTVLMKDDLEARGKARHNWTAEEIQEAFLLMSQLRDVGKSKPDLPPPFVDLPDEDWQEDEPPEK